MRETMKRLWVVLTVVALGAAWACGGGTSEAPKPKKLKRRLRRRLRLRVGGWEGWL